MTEVLLAILVLQTVFIAWQQYFFTKQIQVLVDKLMSRSFREYDSVKNPPPAKPQLPDPPGEDLRILSNITV